MCIKDAVAIRLQNILDERNITIYQLAYDSGVTKSTIYSMVNAERKDVTLSTVKKLCDRLDISITEFFTSQEFYDLEQEIK